MPRLGIQLPSSTNWNPPPILNSAVMNSERTNDAREAPKAIHFSNVSLVLDVNKLMIPPTRGRKMIRLSIASLQYQSACSSDHRQDNHPARDDQQEVLRATRLNVESC